jgi:GNAT superfamily N-acetyltransferase
MEIRQFDAAAAEGAAELFRNLQPSKLTTAEYLVHRERTIPERARRLSLVAVDGDSIVGWGSATRRWESGAIDDVSIWVMVEPSHRRQGLGSELLDLVEQHAISGGAKTLMTGVESDPAGLLFLERHGYEERSAGIVSLVEPRSVDVPARSGFKVLALSELVGLEERLFQFWGEAGAFPSTAQSFEEWRRTVLESPLLEPEGSFTVFKGDRPVALAWLLVDRERARAENEWTATLPDLRGQGLARMAKLNTIRWAAENGIGEILTDSDEDNVAMLELNRSLGYRMLCRRRYFRRVI